ncbi:MAG TPA: hypothetical protein VNN10_00180 [Dehalococcoidia bacterium]|nr:hypothetical protein [Dehalococcoidia bacterium]
MLLAATAAVLLACTTPQGTPVTYKNETGLSLTVTNDDFLLTTLAPTESKRITTKESLLPDRIRAYDERNNLVFDRTVTWEDLKASGFVVVIK